MSRSEHAKRLRHTEGEDPLMEIEIGDTSLMMIFLLEECNFTCPHCVREDEPMDPGYKLSFRQLQLCLSDCRSLEKVRWVQLSGGEPTLWTEAGRDLVDLLLEISKAGFAPGFITNGSSFVDYNGCHDFFGKYVDGSTTPLRAYLSIDTFHRNFDVEEARARSLDNVIMCKQELRRGTADLLDVRVVVVVSKDFKSLLPDEMIRYYESLGVTFGFVPLALEGRAKSLSHLCPDLESDNPGDLGAYQRFHRRESRKNKDKSKNRDKTPHMVLIGNDYYFSDPWRKVARLGHLPDPIIRAYSAGTKA
jgi:pyruvate-formate lyase-activating enzyme